jgi:hypothetical protein
MSKRTCQSVLEHAARKRVINQKERRSMITVPHKARSRRARDYLNGQLDGTDEIDRNHARSVSRVSGQSIPSFLACETRVYSRRDGHIVKHVSARGARRRCSAVEVTRGPGIISRIYDFRKTLASAEFPRRWKVSLDLSPDSLSSLFSPACRARA